MKAVRLFPVILLPILLVGAFLLAARTSAAPDTTIVVDTLEDEDIVDQNCSLREAITAANTNLEVDACPAGELTSTDTITFSVSGTVTLESSLPDIVTTGGPLLINGENAISIDGDNKSKILLNPIGAELTLQNLRITNGTTNFLGGGLTNSGVLTITGCILSGNIISSTLTYGSGGGIYNTGIVTITNTTLTDNHTYGNQLGYGGGLYNAIGGKVYIATSTFSSNTVSGTNGAYGGGLVNAGEMVITSSSIYSNSTASPTGDNNGCGIHNTGIVTITKSTLSDNHATGIQSGEGGGLYNAIEGVFYIAGSTISSNTISGTVKGIGGGLHNAGKMVITSSSIYSNSVASQSGESSGGGIYNTNDNLDISNSTISQNSGGGGVYNEIDGLVDIIHSTFAGNDGWGIYNGKFLTITASIITDECTGSPITDGGDNLEEENTCGFGTGANTDPRLAALADNGGPTLTHALLHDSPAIDAADPIDCPLTDQRGVSRPVDGDLDGEALCDIGSYEFQIPTETTIISDLPDPSYVNQPFTVTTTVSSTIGTPSGTVTVTVGGAEAICSSSLSAGIGSCQLILTSAGTYILEAAFGGDSSFISSTTSAEHVVIKAPSTTTILSDLPDPSMVGETIVVSFEVTAAYAIPTGKVSVYVNETSEMCSNKLVNGEASCELSISKSGLHTLTASFNGNAALNPSSDTEEHTVDQPEPTPDPVQLLFMPLVRGEY